MRHLPALGVVFAAAALNVSAQQAQFQVEVRLIEVEARVVDRDGRPLVDLQRQDFQLREDGVPHDVATLQFVPTVEPFVVNAEPGSAESDTVLHSARPSPTWIYISAEVGPTEFQKTGEAIRRFIARQMKPGFRVSLGGQAFTSDKAQLQATLDAMLRDPFGRGDRAGLADPTKPQQDDAEDQRAMAATFRQQEEGVVPFQGFPSRRERDSPATAEFGRPYLSEARLDRQVPVFGDLALYRYQELVDRLSELQGKKVVVLFRPGLRLESDNMPALRRIASSAVRNRIAFYTVDTRGLDAIVPVEDTPIPFSVDRRRRMTVDPFAKQEVHDITQSGLESLADETIGRAVLDTNGLGEVFDAVVRDASGYYVLGYYPIDLSAEGRYRRIRVSVKRPGARVLATRGYYEPRPGTLFGGEDKAFALRRALLAELPTDLPVVASAGVFSGPGGSPALILAAGVPVGALTPAKASGPPRLEATALVRIASDDEDRRPIYYERRVMSTADKGSWRKLQVDPTAIVSMSDVVAVPPGRYTWRVVFQDDNGSKLGGVEGRADVPDFQLPATPSSVLMTSEVLRRAEPESGAGVDDDVLDAGPLRFMPQPLRVFRQGTVVHLRFDLYNPTPADRAMAEQGPRLGVLRNGQPVAASGLHGQAFPDASGRSIRFACAIETKDLEPGQYTVMLAPPNAEGSRRTLLQIFQLLPAD